MIFYLAHNHGFFVREMRQWFAGKNYPLDGADSDGEQAAAINSLMETAKLDGIDRLTELTDVIAANPPRPPPQPATGS